MRSSLDVAAVAGETWSRRAPAGTCCSRSATELIGPIDRPHARANTNPGATSSPTGWSRLNVTNPGRENANRQPPFAAYLLERALGTNLARREEELAQLTTLLGPRRPR